MAIGELCNREVIVARPETSVAEAARLMREYHVGSLVIVHPVEGGGSVPVGIATDRDLVVEVLAQGVDPHEVALKDIVTRELLTVGENEDVWDVLSTMRRHGVRRIPVVAQDRTLVGIFSADDALELVAEVVGDLLGLIKRELGRETDERP
jgi:CBS domain-containing protein